MNAPITHYLSGNFSNYTHTSVTPKDLTGGKPTPEKMIENNKVDLNNFLCSKQFSLAFLTRVTLKKAKVCANFSKKFA